MILILPKIDAWMESCIGHDPGVEVSCHPRSPLGTLATALGFTLGLWSGWLRVKVKLAARIEP